MFNQVKLPDKNIKILLELMMMNTPYFETDRLILTWPGPEQIDQYYQDIIGTDMFDTILWDGPKDNREIHRYWAEQVKVDKNNFTQALELAIIEKTSSMLIGGCSLRPVKGDHRVVDIGFALAPKFHGKGFATEAVGMAVQEAFLNREAQRVFGTVFVGNKASRRVFEKLGFTHEGTLRSLAYKRGVWKDEWLFAKIRDDWAKEKDVDKDLK
jgi:RimJ/RimL family protein N-acetyltransferase